MADHLFSKSVLDASQPNMRTRVYKKAYKACITCRALKAKCRLAQTSGPCERCVRQSQDCVFAPTRGPSKRKRLSGLDVKEPLQRVPVEEFPHLELMANEKISTQSSRGISPLPQDRLSNSSRLRSSQDQRQRDAPLDSAHNSNMVRTVVTSSKTALGLLFEAAEMEEEMVEEDMTDTDIFRPEASACSVICRGSTSSSGMNPPISFSECDPEILNLWNNCFFVQQGWFSAREAVTYVDLFFKNCVPHSEVLTDEFANHTKHKVLLTEEPFLTSTILMISSRLHVLPGVGGVSRSHFIHDSLWSYVKDLISCLVFGYERTIKATARTVGSIESLLLISEWPPRALHPPMDSRWGFDLLNSGISFKKDDSPLGRDPALYRWRQEVVEPAKQSDRMSHMVLGVAMSLGVELGIFNNFVWTATANPENVRQLRARILLCCFTNRIARRAGYRILVPEAFYSSALDVSQLRLSTTECDWHNYMTCRIDVVKLTGKMIETFFPSSEVTKELLVTEKYKPLLQEFKQHLERWHQKALALKGVTDLWKQALEIEYHHLMMYSHALSIQAMSLRGQISTPTSPRRREVPYRQVPLSDYSLIFEAMNASWHTLQITNLFAQSGTLRFAPFRTYVRIIAAAIFLLKAISIGVRTHHLDASLKILDQCILSLKTTTVDDMHVSSRYGTLLERHVKRFRKTCPGPLKTRDQTPEFRDNSIQSGLQFHLPKLDIFPEPASDDAEVTVPRFWGIEGVDIVEDWLSFPFDTTSLGLDDTPNELGSPFGAMAFDFL